MKKILALVLALVLAGGLIMGCAPKADPQPNTTDTAVAADLTENEPAADVSDKTPEDEPAGSLEGTTVKAMVAYGGASDSFAAFTEKTGIKVEYIDMSTGKALAAFQSAGGVTEADVWFGGGVDSYISAKELGYLMQYESPEAGQINPAYKDEEGYWTGLALVPAGFLVNNDVLTEKGLDAPTTWEDLADPKYKGEIIMASPGISGTQYAILNGLIQALGEEDGWDLWQRIDENCDVYAQGGGEPGPKTAAGEYAIAVLAVTGGTYELESQYPVEVIMPTDYIPWTPAPIGIFHDAKNVEGAKAMLDYYLSKEGQEVLREADARVMARDDVDVPEVMSTLDTSKLIKQDVLLFGSQRDALLEKWDEMVGE